MASTASRSKWTCDAARRRLSTYPCRRAGSEAHMTTRTLLLTLAVAIGIAASARAQTQASPDPQNAQGPLIVERIPSGWVVSPDITITEFNKQAATVIGAYGGWLSDRTWLVGAGGYWLANNTHDFSM